MSRYIQIKFEPVRQEESDILVAQLSEIGFIGFQEEENCLIAFINLEEYDDSLFQSLTGLKRNEYTKTLIEEKNWNKVWESNFEPVLVDEFVAIRASFHEPVEHVKFDIVITPKMSFGTGHHSTTYMMIEQMRKIDFLNKSVFDVGTGTGVLAILAEKMGAKEILAIDNDPFSIENAAENTKINNCSVVDLKLTDGSLMRGQFDVVLANINKNMFLENLGLLSNLISRNGLLLISGILIEDEPEVQANCNRHELKVLERFERLNWLFLKLSHT